MLLIYSLSLRIYALVIRLVAPFHPKAKLWLKGRKNTLRRVRETIGSEDKVIWFHAASLGEFEQGRPLIEEVKRSNPHKKIVLTFFSPSGYEVQKNYPGADLICYIPLDIRWRMLQFVKAVNPEVLFVIKYEFWFNLFRILHNRRIKIYLVSGIFRSNQHFFQWWGRWFRKELRAVTWFFVQDQISAELLKEGGFYNVSISGDTRFDRVKRIAGTSGDPGVLSAFVQSRPLVVAGSTWPQDEIRLLPLINSNTQISWIIAPHQVGEAFVSDLLGKLPAGSRRFSEMEPNHKPRVVVIDSIGLLSQLYRFADVAYIGGGFGKGIHNLAEAAVYGCPVVFGPNHLAFREAVELTNLGAGFPVNSSEEISAIVPRLLYDKELHKKAAEAAGDYISSNLGATRHILEKTGFH
jgi:3-deoxy-D-manno-octulosonic-acid transferase